MSASDNVVQNKNNFKEMHALIFVHSHESHLLMVYEQADVEVNADGNPGFLM